eukprot:3527202-Pyramimonas_sp.AAC.1
MQHYNSKNSNALVCDAAPPVCALSPGHRFPARGGRLSQAFQQLSFIEKLLVVLFDDDRGDSRALNLLELERPALKAF